MNTMTDYDKQATDFLKKHAIRFTATQPKHQRPAPWVSANEPHGREWRIVFSGTTESGLRRLTFPFWNSIAAGSEAPSAYDVLACISSDVQSPATFKDWCADYGYSTDSKLAEATFKRCQTLSVKLQGFFTEQEQTDLQEIQ